MPELILKVGNDQAPDRYQDGDIICAFNRRRIRACHAEMICHVKHVSFNGDGLNPADSLPVHWFENTHQFKFERVSNKEIRRTNLLTLEEDIISDVPNEKGEYMDVPLYLARRKKHEMHRIFGTEGNEFWYGGNVDASNTKLDKVWEKIEELTVKREADHQLWPLSSTEKKHFLALPVDDFTEEERGEYESSELDNEGRVIKKRNNKVNYALLVSVQKLLNIQDKTKEVDLRLEVPAFAKRLIVRNKTLEVEL